MYLINREVRVFGLKVLEVLLLASINVMAPLLATRYLLLLTVPFTIFVYKKISRASKEGCPNYIESTINNITIPKQITDENGIFSKL